MNYIHAYISVENVGMPLGMYMYIWRTYASTFMPHFHRDSRCKVYVTVSLTWWGVGIGNAGEEATVSNRKRLGKKISQDCAGQRVAWNKLQRSHFSAIMIGFVRFFAHYTNYQFERRVCVFSPVTCR